MRRKISNKTLPLLLAVCLILGMLSLSAVAEDGEPGDFKEPADSSITEHGSPDEPELPVKAGVLFAGPRAELVEPGAEPVEPEDDETPAPEDEEDEGEDGEDEEGADPDVVIIIEEDDHGDTVLYLPEGMAVTRTSLLKGVTAMDENGEPVDVEAADTDGLDLQNPQPRMTDELPEPYMITYEAEHPETGEVFTAVREVFVTAAIMPMSLFSGTCGAYLTWTYDDATTVLTITGSGAMYDYSLFDWQHTDPIYNENAPWKAYRDQITRVILPDGLTYIGEYAFCRCTALQSVDFPISSLTDIGEGAFAGYNNVPGCTSLQSVTLPDGLLSIGDKAFAYSGLKSIVIPDSVTTLGGGAFSDCEDLISAKVGSGITVLGGSDFLNDLKLTTVELPDGLKEIGDSSFSCCWELAAINVPSGLEVVGESAFYTCYKLSSFPLPNTVTGIGAQAFYGTRLSGVFTIPANAEIKNHTSTGKFISPFPNCHFITGFAVAPGSTRYTSVDGVLLSADKKTLISCPAGKEGHFVIPDEVTGFASSAFAGCGGIESGSFNPYGGDVSRDLWVTLSGTLNNIVDSPFAGCPLMKVIVPENVASVSYNAFGIEFDNRGNVFCYYDSDFYNWVLTQPWPIKPTYLPHRGTLLANMPTTIYQNIPYEFLFKTSVPNNTGVKFDLDPALPSGLTLATARTLKTTKSDALLLRREYYLPGTIYGSTSYVDTSRTYTLKVWQEDVPRSVFEIVIEFTFKYEPTPENELLFNKRTGTGLLNKYALVKDTLRDRLVAIGDLKTVEGYTGDVYAITGEKTSVVDQKMEIDAEYKMFDSLWLDGKVLQPDQYEADEGSTVVTLLAQTIQNLDNGEHTAAAAFIQTDPNAGWQHTDLTSTTKVASDLDFVAQTFVVKWGSDPVTGSNNTSRSTRRNNTGNNNTIGANNPVGTNDPAGATEPTATTDPAGTTAPAGTTDLTGTTDPAGTTEPGGGDAGNTGGAGGGGAPAPTAGPEAVSGLPTDESGNFFFNLDGSSAPMQIRIDIPLDEFDGLRVDGELWTQGEDYTVTSGSTILTIAAARLEQLAVGDHTIEAIFAGQTVEIAFALNKPAATDSANAPAISDFPAAESGSGSTLPIAAGIAAALLLAVVVIWRARFKRRTGVAE